MSEPCGNQGTPKLSVSCDDDTPCEQTFCETKRRRLLAAVAAGGSLSLAGCTGLLAATDTREPDDEFDVEYVAQDQTISVRRGQTLLGAGEDAGMDLPYVCRAGFCGVCLAQADGDANEVVDMKINDFDPLTEEAVDAGFFLPCTSQPRDNLAMDTDVGAGDLAEFAPEDDDEEDDVVEGVFHRIRFLEEQWTMEIHEDENLLEAGEDRGLDLPYECRSGFCGVCLAKADGDASELVEMTTNDYDPLDEEAIQEGYHLTCTGHPRGDFDIETGRYGDLE